MSPATESLAGALVNVTGALLADVQYGLLSPDENQDVGSTAMQLGGEVALTFSNDHQVHFTWGGWPGASQDWVLRGTSTRLCTTPTKCIDASSLGPWPSLVVGRSSRRRSWGGKTNPRLFAFGLIKAPFWSGSVATVGLAAPTHCWSALISRPFSTSPPQLKPFGVVAVWHNTTVKGTAGKLCLPVPSALRAPAAPYLRRWAS